MRTTFLMMALLGILGCNNESQQPDFPNLHPVKGVVKLGGQPVKGGTVQFVPEPDRPEFLINSEVSTDGTFTLSTVRTTDRKGERRAGAPTGNYRVTYIPMISDQQAGGIVEPVTTSQLITVQEGPNDLTISYPARK
ncbi:MAG: hypothetical protein N2112_01520 [Gemmataceae bacterium]|jgi:hypothetical protein|nr:hypothetical protein [Gemmataceae bacterium]